MKKCFSLPNQKFTLYSRHCCWVAVCGLMENLTGHAAAYKLKAPDRTEFCTWFKQSRWGGKGNIIGVTGNPVNDSEGINEMQEWLHKSGYESFFSPLCCISSTAPAYSFINNEYSMEAARHHCLLSQRKGTLRVLICTASPVLQLQEGNSQQSLCVSLRE